METTKTEAELSQYLTFWMAGEEYAIGILKVKEIIEYGAVTRVPSTPTWIRGVINLRGTVVPVVDLAVKFGLSPNPITKQSCIVIVEIELAGQPTTMGVLADSVSEVIDLGEGDIEAPPAFGSHIRVDYLVGMGKVGKRFALILDIDRVLSTDELLALNLGGEAAEVATEQPHAPEAQA